MVGEIARSSLGLSILMNFVQLSHLLLHQFAGGNAGNVGVVAVELLYNHKDDMPKGVVEEPSGKLGGVEERDLDSGPSTLKEDTPDFLGFTGTGTKTKVSQQEQRQILVFTSL